MSTITKKIPKIIHQIWIGSSPKPTKFMKTWEDKHPYYEYICWNEEEIIKRKLELRCINRINEIEEINGKADIIRWEILFKYGGLFVDADSICIEPFDYLLNQNKPFVGYEHEQARPNLVATGTMAFPKNHPLCLAAIDWIIANPVSYQQTNKMAWKNVGPGLLTMLINTHRFNDMVIYPSYYFLPVHYTGVKYTGHAKVYAYQEWGSTKQNYNLMNMIELADEYKIPTENISILAASYNTKHEYIIDCLESIKEQQGHFGIELVWINDGSDYKLTKLLEQSLNDFKNDCRFVKIIYKKWDKNMGLSYSLNQGVLLCSNEIIIRMDSDDVMVPNRIQQQINFMKMEKDCVICGTNINTFKSINNNVEMLGKSYHPYVLTWDEYKLNPKNWITNHPTLCFKKSAVLEVGNYNKENKLPCEDLELELKLLKRYGKLYNIQECLLYYRLHDNQLTANSSCSKPANVKYTKDLIDRMINT